MDISLFFLMIIIWKQDFCMFFLSNSVLERLPLIFCHLLFKEI